MMPEQDVAFYDNAAVLQGYSKQCFRFAAFSVLRTLQGQVSFVLQPPGDDWPTEFAPEQ